MDALMAVGAMETVTAVKTCGSAELLGGASSWEDALLHWVNGVRSKPVFVIIHLYCILSEITNCSGFYLSFFNPLCLKNGDYTVYRRSVIYVC